MDNKNVFVQGFTFTPKSKVVTTYGSDEFALRPYRKGDTAEDFFDLYHTAKEELDRVLMAKHTHRNTKDDHLMRDIIFIETRTKEYINAMVVYGLKKGWLRKKSAINE